MAAFPEGAVASQEESMLVPLLYGGKRTCLLVVPEPQGCSSGGFRSALLVAGVNRH
jgi:hypothetical protein